ncbi:unnamed protein product [Adineta ricciae]|uniref:Dynamin N-terminal domain-containing protein n=1 Tax=Adineta ricciae TaxID=249248 RepID=A0A814Y024_ADIRI|nr:unnamed protein product [Adineta ricciae]CAF1222527.1 unnamed protein product [Adineta ricciae]
MFTNRNQPEGNAATPQQNGVNSSSPTPTRALRQPPPIPSKPRNPVPEDPFASLDSFIAESFSSSSTTDSNPASSNYFYLRSYPPAANSDSTLSSSALQASYIRAADSAKAATGQIVDDKKEAVHIIANYAIEPLEMLHLVDRWIQQLLGEFHQQRDTFKHRLSDKWQNEELSNIQYDNNDRIRKIYAAFKQLQTARDSILSREAFDDLSSFLRNAEDLSTEEMKEKFNSLANEYSKILRCLDFIDREVQTGPTQRDNYLSGIERDLSKLKKLNSKMSSTICIIGLEKAGKSTFINALLGYELLPAASERCTQVRTVLKPPTQDKEQHLYAKVQFYDDQEFQTFHEQMPKKTDESEEQLKVRKLQVAEERESLREKFPEERFYIKNPADFDRERTAIHQELHKYITGELYVNIIKEIAIYTDRLPGKNYELLDVPGFDSPIKEHRDAGLEAIKNADAFLFLTNGQQPSLTQPQIQLLNEIRQNHFEAMERAFGIITKLDLCQTSDTFKEHHQNSYHELIEKGFKPEHIFCTCSRLQLLDPNCLDDGFQRSKDALNRFIEFELPKTHLKQLIDLGRMHLTHPVVERLEKIKEKQLLPVNLADMSIDDYIKQQKTESWDAVYDKSIFNPAFAQANSWHTKVVTKERAKFANTIKQKFHDSFIDRTQSFLQITPLIEDIMCEQFEYSKLQLNIHPTDNAERGKLSMELEKIVHDTSIYLADYFYREYICGFEVIINGVCPFLKDLFRTQLTLEKCLNETHALILRVARPMIMAALRYSHLDLPVKRNAIQDLIYIAPTAAATIVRHKKESKSSFAAEIEKQVKELNSQHDLSTPVIHKLFE